MVAEPSLSITEMVNGIPNLWNFGVGLRKEFINRNGFIYACDFEARLNIDLISSVNIDKLNGTVNTPAFSELVNNFETSATLAMVVGIDRLSYRRLTKLLKKHWEKLDKPLEDEGDNPINKDSVETALENFSFAVRKIEALKRIAKIAEQGAPFLKDFYLDRRFRNLSTALQGIHKCLEKIIKEIG